MSTTESPPRRVSIGRRIALAVLALVVVLIAVGLVERWRTGARAVSDLQALTDELDADDPNWRLADLDAARAEVPADENSARVVAALARHLRSWSPPYDDISPPSGTPANVRLDAAKQVRLRQEIGSVAGLVVEGRKLAAMPRGRHELKINLDHPMLTMLPDQQNTRRVVQLLHYDAIDRAHAGDFDGAIRSCQAGMNAAASLGDEPILISQLVRVSCFLHCGDGVERVLGLGVSSEKALVELQRHIETEARHNGMLAAMRGERASLHATVSSLSRGTLKLSDIPDSGSLAVDLRLREQLAPFTLRQLARDEHAALLRLANRSVEIARLPTHEQPAAEALLERDLKKQVQRVRLMQAVLPALSRYSEAERRKAALSRCLMAAVAVERFRLREDRWPASLEELKPGLLKEVPLDPYDGKPLRYKSLADGVVVYSIGHDASDDGGAIDRTKPLTRGTDLGYRLWDADRRNEAAKAGVPGKEDER